jgi:hypothetical protein
VQLEDCGHVFEFSDLDRWMDRIENDSNDAAVKLKECPRCKTAIRRNLRYGNLIKQALRDIELVKKRMLGDEIRKHKLAMEITRGLPNLAIKDARKIKVFYAELTKGPYDENALVAIENQMNIIKNVNDLIIKFKEDKKTGSFLEIYDKALTHLNAVYVFTLRKRRYFTTQETLDISNELERLRRLRIFMKYKERRRVVEAVLSRALSIDFIELEAYLTGRRKMSPNKLNFIDKTLDALKTAIPLSGLSISDKERLAIVTAIGLGQGHWFKCPKGECSYIICFLCFSTMLWETVEKRTNIF